MSLKMVQERLTKTLIGPSVSFFPVDPETQSFIGAAGGGGGGDMGCFLSYTIDLNRLYWQALS